MSKGNGAAAIRASGKRRLEEKPKLKELMRENRFLRDLVGVLAERELAEVLEGIEDDEAEVTSEPLPVFSVTASELQDAKGITLDHKGESFRVLIEP